MVRGKTLAVSVKNPKYFIWYRDEKYRTIRSGYLHILPLALQQHL
jgi:hypothetical protein